MVKKDILMVSKGYFDGQKGLKKKFLFNKKGCIVIYPYSRCSHGQRYRTYAEND
jgi:hypothetical protein